MATIQEQIETLVALQALELEANAADRQIQSLRDAAAALDRAAVERESLVAGEKERLLALQKNYRELEAEFKVNAGMVEKSNVKLGAVKTNKEYQSTLKEIEEIEKKNSAIEDRMIEQLDAIESQEIAVKESQAQLDGFLISCREKRADAETRIQQIRQTVADLNEKIVRVRTAADPKCIAVLDAVKKKVRGMAVVAAEHETCTGCHMNIPAQLFNELLRFDELRFCPHCHRIIYWKEKEIE
ncbi:hypothetical protein DSCO28_07050 [Desulfosarcina ovata subsp. sediminis]|uniref:C4-type zinc ribbon domain-containing protein n=1 Tax=Desulfosarcina ovata subsp. sediminis TaxID=885957 RepID=A0A5K7ZKG6_9BACT|nr:C4-type zinc ribbon domain-containing protein [Desulfosarcina ovata]BBO80139.1 hypothetical protein DSCO28_07050 [Desulfosarcina ovata subsp. sediminis]